MKRCLPPLLMGLLVGAIASRVSAEAEHPCAADQQALCPQTGKDSMAIARCFREHHQELSRACSDFYEASLSRSTEWPVECLADSLRLCAEPWTMIRETRSCLEKAPSVDVACSGWLKEPVPSFNYQVPRGSPAYNLARILADSLALVERGAAEPRQWKTFINEAGLLMRTYAGDRESLLRDSVNQFLQAFNLPERWDSRVDPKPLEELNVSRVTLSFREALHSLRQLTQGSEWPPLSAEESQALRRRMEILFPLNRPIPFPAIAQNIENLRSWCLE